MTGELLIDSLISIAGVALIVLVARLAFSAPSAPVTEESARERIAFEEPDFNPRCWLVDKKGRAAIAEGANGDFVLVKKVGLDLAVRRFSPARIKAEAKNGVLTLRFGEPGLGRAEVAGGEAVLWALKVAGEDGI